MVPVGIVGLSPAWETRYRPAIRSLSGRIAIRAIYDPVANRAEMAASEFEAATVTGIRSLARRADLKALLILDRGWCGNEAIRLLCDLDRPMFIGGAIANEAASFDRLHDAVRSTGVMVMPELGQRYTAATIRLRELIATSLGRPRVIDIEADAPAVPPEGQPLGAEPWSEFIARLVDWCCAVITTQPVEILAQADRDKGPETILMQFARPRSGGAAPIVTIRLREGAARNKGCATSPIYRVECENGTAEITSPQQIAWQAGDRREDECLTSERSDLQVMLDHFCRRVVGGLVPVADLGDVRRSWILAQAAAESMRTRSAVRLAEQLN